MTTLTSRFMTQRASLQVYLSIFLSIALLACNSSGGESSSAIQPDNETTASNCTTQLLGQICGSSWVSDCVDQTTHYTKITLDFYDDQSFQFTGQNYSDSSCLSEVSSLIFSGGIVEEGDIMLLDGSTGRKVQLHIDYYDGSDIDPVSVQYVILQLDASDPDIIYMGDSNDTTTERDVNNRVRTSIPYRKQ